MIGDEGALLYPPNRLAKTYQPLFAQSHSDKDTKPLIEMIASAPHYPIHMLVDLRTQTIKNEKLPSLSYFDRKKLITRRLQQAFPKTDLRAASCENNINCILTSLDQTDTITNWLDILRTLPNPFSGISLAPCELPTLLQHLAPHAKEGWRMLLIYHKTGGFRQIVTHYNKLVFSRLTPLLPSTTSLDYVQERLAQDVQATRDYLRRFNLKENTDISLVGILPPHFKKIKFDNCVSLILSPFEAASHAKLPYSEKNEVDFGDHLSILWARQGFFWKSQLFNAEDKNKWRHCLLKYAGFLLAAHIFGLAALNIATTGIELAHDYYLINQLQTKVKELNEEFSSIKKAFSSPSQSLGELRQAVEKKRFFTQPIKTPKNFLHKLHKTLKNKAVAKSIKWQKNETTIDLQLIGQKNLLDSEIIALFDRLAVDLKKSIINYNVTITKYPFPNQPNETITNKSKNIKTPVSRFVFKRVTP